MSALEPPSETCPHCLALRELLAETNAKLGRPIDSFDHDIHALPRAAFPSKDEVASCDCRCHSHLRMGRT